MDYRAKLKKRLKRGIAELILGIIVGIVYLLRPTDNGFLPVLSLMLCCVGILYIIEYFRKTRNDEVLYQHSIKETDERNKMISLHARSKAINIYVMVGVVVELLFYLLGWDDRAQVVAYSLCSLLLIYYISYLYIKRKC